MKNFHFSFWDPSLTSEGSSGISCDVLFLITFVICDKLIHDDDDEEDILYDDEVTMMMEIRLGKF